MCWYNTTHNSIKFTTKRSQLSIIFFTPFFFCSVVFILFFTQTIDQIHQDSIEELNNLIGELDSFQREHENYLRENPSELDDLNSDLNEKLSGLSYSTTSSDSRCFNYSDVEITRYTREKSDTSDIADSGVGNPSIKSNDSDSQVILRNEYFPYETEKYLRQNSEIVVLRCKEPDSPSLTNELEESQQQRFSSFKNDERINCSSSSSGGKDEYVLSKVNLKKIELAGNEKYSMDERLRLKPVVSPRPASLSGLCFKHFFYFF